MDSFKEKITSRIPDRSSLPSPGDKLKSLVGRGGGSGNSSPVSARPITALGDPNRFGPPPKRTLPSASTEAATLDRTDTGGSSGSSATPTTASKPAPPLPSAKQPRPPIVDHSISGSPKPSLPPRLPPRSGSISSPTIPTPSDDYPPPPSGRRPILSTPSEYTQQPPKPLASNIQIGPAKLPPLPDVDLLGKSKKSSFSTMFANKKPTTVLVKTESGREISFDSYADDAQMKRIAEKGYGADAIGIKKDAPEQSGWGIGKDVATLISADGGRKPALPPPSRTQPQSRPLTFEESKAKVLAPFQSSSGREGFSWKEAKETAAAAKQNYNTAKEFEAAHGDQVRSGLASANKLQERHGDKITKVLGEEQAGQVKMGLQGATKSADLSKAVVGKKKPPPPPPKKKPELSVGGLSAGGPPPVNFSSRPV